MLVPGPLRRIFHLMGTEVSFWPLEFTAKTLMNHLRGWKFRFWMPEGFCSFGGVWACPDFHTEPDIYFLQALNSTRLQESFQFHHYSSKWEGLSKVPLVATGGGCGCGSSAPKIEIINHNLVIIGLQVNPWPGNICCFSSKILKISSTSEFGIIECFGVFLFRSVEMFGLFASAGDF